MNPHRRAFSLIELLVVMAILSVLASILFPSIAAVSRRSHQILCLNNQKQLALASTLYWADHQDQCFPYLVSTQTAHTDYWFGRLARGAEGERQLDRTQGLLWPYLKADGLELCPSFQYQAGIYKPKALGASYGYGYNFHLAGGVGAAKRSSKVSHLASTASTALFADAAQINDFQFPASPTRPLLEEFYYISDGPSLYANGHFRHQKRAVVSFCDGHASMASSREGSRDERLPQAWVARFEPSILRP